MFCPQCGVSQGDELKFCKACGANLYAVRKVVTSRDTDEKFDWNKTWVAEMLLSSEEQKQRKRERGGNLSLEEKRYNEIKAGIITSFVGIGVMIFLYVLMQGIILSGQNPPKDVEILSRIWVAGVIPFFVGIGLLISGLFVRRRLVEPARQIETKETARGLDSARSKDELSLSSKDWYETGASKTSVTEHTTRELGDISKKQ
jgi:hypothetical protein